MDYRGKHVTADLWLEHMPAGNQIMQACECAIKRSGMAVVAATYKNFEPTGLTAVWILQESHFTVHTYPEHKYISVDCYTCGQEGCPDKAIEALIALLDVRWQHIEHYERGNAALALPPPQHAVQ